MLIARPIHLTGDQSYMTASASQNIIVRQQQISPVFVVAGHWSTSVIWATSACIYSGWANSFVSCKKIKSHRWEGSSLSVFVQLQSLALYTLGSNISALSNLMPTPMFVRNVCLVNTPDLINLDLRRRIKYMLYSTVPVHVRRLDAEKSMPSFSGASRQYCMHQVISGIFHNWLYLHPRIFFSAQLQLDLVLALK